MRSVLLLGLPLLLLASACTYDNGHVHRLPPPAGSSCPSPSTPAQTSIDVDKQIEIQAGDGAGVFVEYAAGGHWQIRTACDTLKNNADCSWDVLVTPEDGTSIVNVVADDLESNDSIGPYPDDSVSYQLLASTGSDIDGFSFDSEPSASVMVDAYLDDQCALSYFYWVGDGALHQGSPTNPLIFTPAPE
jgi:hypothetical protein